MPDPATNAAIISGSAQLAASGVNAAVTSNLNKKNRKFAEHMYNRQYQDNIALWNLQNEYNLPAAQMQRFKDAGLNPNLIYGQTNEGGSIQSANFHQPETRVPEWGDIALGASSAIDQYYNVQMKQAQVDNMREQNLVLKHEAALRAVQGQRAAFDLGLESELRDTSADFRREKLRQTKVEIGLSQNRDFRDTVKSASDRQEAMSRLETAVEQRSLLKLSRAKTRAEIDKILLEQANVRKQLDILSSESSIKSFDAELVKKGIRPTDALPYRLIMEFYHSLKNFKY